jgi:hypothetical protein
MVPATTVQQPDPQLEPEALRQNLENITAVCDPDGDNSDWPIAIEGEESSGKSALAQAIALEIEGDDFDPEEQIAFSAEEFKEKARKLPPGSVIIFDEGVDALLAEDTMTSEARSLVKFFRKCRELNLITIVIMPVFLEMNKRIRKKRVKTLIRCVKQGFGADADYWAAAWNKTQIRQSDLSSDLSVDEVSYPDAALAGIRWGDPRHDWPQIWEQYKALKNQDVRDPEEEEDDLDLGQVVRIVKSKKPDYITTYQGRKKVDKDLVAHDFDIGGRKARRVKKVVERDLKIGQFTPDDQDDKEEQQ